MPTCFHLRAERTLWPCHSPPLVLTGPSRRSTRCPTTASATKLDGELLVSPAPTWLHQRAVRELVELLLPYVKTVGLELFFAPTAVTWGPRTEVQPDVLAVPRLEGRPAQRFEDVGVLSLAVEVLSPSTARQDRYKKRPEFQRRAVPEFWIVDPASRLVERWCPNDEKPEVLLDFLVWQPSAEVAPLAIDLTRYVRAIHGD